MKPASRTGLGLASSPDHGGAARVAGPGLGPALGPVLLQRAQRLWGRCGLSRAV